MRKLDWKVAFAGGAVAGLTIGGFAIAQADDAAAPAIDGIDLGAAAAQASPVDPMLSPMSMKVVADSARRAVAVAVAGLTDAPDDTAVDLETPAGEVSVDGIDTPGDSPDTPVDLDTPDGQDSVDAVDTPGDSPVDLDTPDGGISVDGVDTVDSPDAIGPTPVEVQPAPAPAPDDSPDDPAEPVEVDSPDDPAEPAEVDSPDDVESAD